MNEQGMDSGKRRRFTVRERRTFVEKYHRSGLTQRAFVEKHGISLASLTNWLRVYGDAAPEKAIGFDEVDLKGMLGGPAWSAELSLPDGSVLKIGAQANPALVVGLAKVLRRAC